MTDVQDKHSKAAPPLSFLIETLECHQTSLGGGGTERNVGERGAQTCTRHRGMPGTEQAQGCLSIILKGKELRNGRGQGRSVILVY